MCSNCEDRGSSRPKKGESMAPTLKIAFWNVQNVFWPGRVPRGLNKPSEFGLKLDRLAQCINDFFANAMPDFLCLAEIEDEALARELAKRLHASYVPTWEQAGRNVDSGLGFLSNSATVAKVAGPVVCRPTLSARPRAIAVECHMRQVREPFLLVINHWRSRMPPRPGDLYTPADDRRHTADWIRKELGRHPDTPAILIGDFNAEPTEAPFNQWHLDASRNFPIHPQNDSLYNTAWRFLTEPLRWENRLARIHEPRPKRTFGEYPIAVFDQLLVSRQAMAPRPFGLLESTIRYYCRDNVNSRVNTNGVMFPFPWDFRSDQDYQGASDHYPLLAEFAL
jgi:exonuclease III